MHQQPKYTILTDKPTIWKLKLTYQDIFDIASIRTSYLEDKSPDSGISSTQVIMNDDKPMFNYYLAIAISELTGYLAKRLNSDIKIKDDNGETIENSGLIESSESVTYYLVMSMNHESHLISSLYRHSIEYLVRRTLEQWYNTSFNSETERYKIHEILEYRRKPITRPASVI